MIARDHVIVWTDAGGRKGVSSAPLLTKESAETVASALNGDDMAHAYQAIPESQLETWKAAP